MRMTQKRWEIIDEEFISYTGGTAQLISNGECKVHLWEPPKDAQLFCDKLNAINEENEQLKQQKQQYKGQRDYLLFVIERTCSKELFEETKSYLKEVE